MLKIYLNRFVKLGFLSLLCLYTGCVSFFSGTSQYDSKNITVQTLNLFSQRKLPSTSDKNWRGNWLFRRRRLRLIDDELRLSKPDIFVYQDGMERIGSPSESDFAILSAGALEGYEWQKVEVQSFDDTQERLTMGVAIDLPLRFEEITVARKSWVLGNDGFMVVNVIDLEDQPIVIFNVQMPPKIGRKYLWYTFIQERVVDFVRTGKYCPKRIVIAGYLPTEQGAKRFTSFKDALQLKDSADTYCNVASDCYTATPSHEIYMATNETAISAHVDRVLVNVDTLVYASGRNMRESDSDNVFFGEFNLSKSWPSQRYGWSSTVRLPRCTDDDIIE